MNEKLSFEAEITTYVEAGFPILYLYTFEEGKAVKAICKQTENIGHRPKILIWDGTDRVCDETGAVLYKVSPQETLAALLDDQMTFHYPQFLIFKNIDTFMDDPSVIARLKKMALMIHEGQLESATIFIVSPVLRIPKEIEKYVTVVETDYLDIKDIQSVVDRILKENEKTVSEDLKKKFAAALKGLSEFEIEDLMRLVCTECTDLTTEHISVLSAWKRQMIKKTGILEMVQTNERLEDIGGLENLKAWLQRKAKVFQNTEAAKEFGVDIPKGVLIAGVPGCGKSLSAKATAKLFDVPLLRLDMGRLLGKYVGESETNMRKAIELAEAVSPCVLWIDELEKAFAGIGGDGGGAEVTTRLFGSFLTWLQEKESPVFVVATANNIKKLPPELLRKGRFDEIFYVGLPSRTERKKIFEIHIGKRRSKDLAAIQSRLPELVDKTEGYSGADIEGVVRESVELAYTNDKDALTADDILKVIKSTHSLSEVMEKAIKEMKDEYEKRKFTNASIKE